MKLFRRPSAIPLWRDEFAIDVGDERYVSRRQFAKFLVLTSLGMFVGNLWILARAWWRRAPDYRAQPVVRLGEIPVHGSKLFNYPGPQDPCLVVRTAEDTYVAYSQKCTHLSCAVYYGRESGRLECPCHEGAFSAADGSVIQGPPPRPLARVRLERRGDTLVAVGMGAADPAGKRS
jgi:nitrite reductase/ring-hydroxylating ferredoxin subunit